MLPGPTGAEVVEELEMEGARLRRQRGRLIAWLWSWAHLIRPHTWLLAVELRGGTPDHTLKRRAHLRTSGTAWGASILDLKLGIRMLVKHPAVTLVIVFALGIGIPASLAPHLLVDAVFDTPLPVEDGDRIKALVMWNPESGDQGLPHLDDYELWREQLTTFGSLGAASRRTLNLIEGDGSAAPVSGAMMTASSFAMTRVAPLLGRTLFESDELLGAPEVAVIGYDLWQARFEGASDVIGRTVRVAGTATTIVGVMPEGYAFPSSEQLWLPLRAKADEYAQGGGPLLWVYGRLADRISAKQAQAELEVVGRRCGVANVADADEATARQPEVARFSALSFGTPRGLMWILLSVAQMLPIFLLLIACGNVAVLLLARTANRAGEFAIRTALGASRLRVVTQLFTETLLLATLATGFGLFLLHVFLSRLEPLIGGPFWLTLRVTPEVVVKAFALAIFSAVVAGVLPAVRATGRNVHATLQRAEGGRGRCPVWPARRCAHYCRSRARRRCPFRRHHELSHVLPGRERSVANR